MRVLRPKASTFSNPAKPTRRPKFAKELAFHHAEKNFIFFPTLRCLNFYPTAHPKTNKNLDNLLLTKNDTDEKAHTANITYTQAGVSCFVGQESGKFKVQFFVGSLVVKIPACV